MGYKSTINYTRQTAISLLVDAFEELPNDVLRQCLQHIAQSGYSRMMAAKDPPLVVSEFGNPLDFRVPRLRAIQVLAIEIIYLPNVVLGNMMDAIADGGKSRTLSELNNFIVRDVEDY